MSSELRYRGAGGSSSMTTVDEPPSPTLGEVSQEDKEKVVEELMSMVQKLRAGPKPGLSNEAKAAKDALAVDPFNMMSIMRLGLAYAQDEQWKQCANVMMRGFKRVKEFHEPVLRVQFLTVLCQASLVLKKYKQALAVLQDIEEPLPEDCDEHTFAVLKCQVFCWNDQDQKGMKAFAEAIEGHDFQTMCGVWVQCWSALQKVGMKEVAKSKIASVAESEEDKAKFEAMEKLAEMKASIIEEKTQSVPMVVKALLIVFWAVILSGLIYGLYLLEQKSLKNLKILK